MIVDPKLLSGSGDEDAPPAYDDVRGPSTASTSTSQDRKRTPSPTRPHATLEGFGRAAPPPSGWLPWLTSTTSRTDKELRRTVLGLVRDLVTHASGASDAIPILQSCAEACRARGLALEALLQESSIEGHTPLYWAIVKREPHAQTTLVDLLLSFPLKASTLADARAACVLAGDDALFQRVRRAPGAATATEELLLGAPPDDRVLVENAPGEGGAFKVHIRIAHFQKRMRVTKNIRIEFIARGRIWQLSFGIAGHAERFEKKAGTWIASIGLLDDSAPTYLDSRLSVLAPPAKPITFRLQAGVTRLGERIPGGRRKTVIVGLADAPGGADLEFDGSPHVLPDGALDVLFEAQLAPPSRSDAECIVC